MSKAELTSVIFRNFLDFNGRYTTTDLYVPDPTAVDDDDDDIERLRYEDEEEDPEEDQSANHIDGRKKRELKADQRYVHLGLKKALLAQSCGVLFREKYIRTLQLIGSKDPSVFTQKFRNLVFKEEVMAEEVGVRTFVCLLFTPAPKLLFILFLYIFQAKRHFEETSSSGSANQKPTSPAEGPVNFTIEIFIDGAQVFKNSKAGQMYPIYGRVHAVGAHVIPIRRSKPFVIGIYYGVGQPDMDAFLYDLMEELKEMKYDESAPDFFEKDVTVQLRAVIADGPMRAKLKGVVGHMGFWSCERCRTRGRNDTLRRDGKKNGMHFPEIGAEVRCMEHWEQYQEKELEEEKPSRVHVKKKTPFWDLWRNGKLLDLIYQFVLDSMHTIDGGATPQVIRRIFGTKRKREGLNQMYYKKANAVLDAWARCTPNDFQRRTRPLTNLEQWKMVEGRTFLFYLSIALFEDLKLKPKELPKYRIVQHLLLAVRLISGDSLEPLDSADIEDSREHFRMFFKLFRKQFGKHACTPKIHNATHLPDDSANLGGGLDAISAYPFEAFMPLLTQVKLFIKISSLPFEALFSIVNFSFLWHFQWARSGKNVLLQMVKGMMLFQKYGRPELDEEDEVESFAEEKCHFFRNDQDLAYPPFYLKEILETRMTETAVCAGTKITNRFPNNIIEVEDEGERKVFIVESIEKRANTARLTGVLFSNCASMFLTPYDSERIGVFKCSHGAVSRDFLRASRTFFDLSEVRGKFFAVPLGVISTVYEPRQEDFDPFNPELTWAVTRLRHCEYKS